MSRTKKLRRFIVIVIFIVSVSQLNAQETPVQLLQGVRDKLVKVQDYSADVQIKADIPLIKILPVNAEIFFKQPDKLKLVSKSIAIMPRQGFGDYVKIVGDSTTYTAFSTGFETIEKLNTEIISVIPSVDTGDLILAKFWIDASDHLIVKSQLTSRTNGTMTVSYSYGAMAKFGLPDIIIFMVDMKKFKIPKMLTSNPYSDDKKGTEKATSSKKGIIEIKLTNYKINPGLEDSFF
ncbi:MAG: hypothetical protein HOO86_16835 [Bacteroidales bacterium]|nr:hypothetical protein [Bacteroidales bacterium]